MLPFTRTELDAAIASGRVTQRKHPTRPYYIYNYSPEVQYSNHWDEVTLNCRGLILDRGFNIVARPWKKFFNLGQVNLPIQFDDPVEVMDKADGSLGILYYGESYFADFRIATRGSFESDQAHFATRTLKSKYLEWSHAISRYRCGQACCNDWQSGVADRYTFLFEIIYPANRIVLDYGDMENLILLGAVENATGYYLGPVEASAISGWPGPVVEVMPFDTISMALAFMDRPNAEGYVIRSHNFLVKLKQPDYLELHRLVTNASPKTVWDQLRQGKSKSEIVSAFPDEFHDYIEGMINPLIDAFVRRCDEIFEGYGNIMGGFKYEASRKQYAQAFKRSQDARYYFLMLDDKPIRDVLWTELRPRETALDVMSR